MHVIYWGERSFLLNYFILTCINHIHKLEILCGISIHAQSVHWSNTIPLYSSPENSNNHYPTFRSLVLASTYEREHAVLAFLCLT
jgi:hypothetical protein